MRSLLQKAVRRGDGALAERALTRVNAAGDKTWLRSRAVVIAFEECWPAASRLKLDRTVQSRLEPLLAVSRSVKWKDAAGLGALSHALAEGDVSVLSYAPSERALRIVVEASKRPAEFFEWVRSQVDTSEGVAIVHAAQAYLAVATWPWDKATIIAGAYLATGGVPVVQSASPPLVECPLWVALDKHTPEGKVALRAASEEIGVSYRQLMWAGFYFESAKVNDLAASPWWEAERAWRLSRAGLGEVEAAGLWERGRNIVRDRLAPVTAELSASLGVASVDGVSTTPNLFDETE